MAPPGTPTAIAERINRDALAALSSTEVSGKLRLLSLDPGATSRADTTKFFAEEAALWSTVIKEAKIEPQ